jgi:hypothetical protein
MSKRLPVVLLVLPFVLSSFSLGANDGSVTANDVLAKHLEAIGAPEARAAIKTRIVQGSARYKILVGGGGEISGQTGMVSDGRKLRFMVKFPQDYRGENFLWNGDVVRVAFSNSSQSRSPFSGLVLAQDTILKEGLFGGTLSTAWPLLDVPGRKPKLIYDGLKKVDGRDLHRFSYIPKKSTDLVIRLFFDPETFRHVLTVYTLEIGNNVGQTVTESASLKAERTVLQERFADFTVVDGITLPTHWTIQLSRELPDGSTTLSNWDLKEEKIRQNVTLDPRNFEAK